MKIFFFEFSGKIIVVSNCNDSFNVEQSIIRINHTDTFQSNCTWTIIGPSKTKINITISEPFNKSLLTISNGIQFTEDNLLKNFNTSIIQSWDNILKVHFDSKSYHIGDDLIIHYKTTGN